MLNDLALTYANPPRCPIVPPHYRESSRVELRDGRPVASVIHLSNGVEPAIAIELACFIARTTRSRVSVLVAGPLHLLPALVARSLSNAGLSADYLEVAVAGQTLQQAGIDTLLALSALRDQGVGIALSGFGIAKLDLVPRLPLSAVILTPSAIRRIPGDPAAIASLHALLQVANNNGLHVVATGIVSEAQRALLSGLGVSDGEGTLFGATVVYPAGRRNLTEA